MAMARTAAPAKKAPARVTPKTPASKPAPAPAREPTPWEAWKASPDLAIAALCAYIVKGGNIAELARERAFTYSALRQWIEADAARAAAYARAREDRSDTLADEIVAISDELAVEEVRDADGNKIGLKLDATAVQRNRLRVDARKWVAAKLKPRVYGEKLDVTAAVTIKDVSDDQLRERASVLLRLAGLTAKDATD